MGRVWDAPLNADVETHYIEGYARQREGLIGFEMPLVSHIDGNLYQGGCIDGVKLADDFEFVVSLYDGEEYKLGPNTFRIQVDKMYDSASSDHMFEDADLYKLANVVLAFSRQGKTLVHCQAGLNRSGLITGLALVLGGMEPVDAIALQRERRSPAVLCNHLFEEWLLQRPAGARLSVSDAEATPSTS